MTGRRPTSLAAVLLVGLGAADARAQGADRDWFLNPPPAGTFVTTDASTGGPQLGIERRDSIADEAGMTVLRASSLAGIGYGEGAVLGDVRFLFFTAGFTAGYRQVWKTYAPPRGVDVTRAYRLDVDDRGAATSEGWGFGEGRLRLALPLDGAILVANHAVRYEGAPENSYDWFHSTVHDGGWMFRFDATLFFRSPKYGAIGPLVRYLDLDRGGRRVGEWAFGLSAGTRLGLAPTVSPDVLLLQVLTRPGDDRFGIHLLRAPVFVLVAYRMTFTL
jgi:hypothetical protein